MLNICWKQLQLLSRQPETMNCYPQRYTLPQVIKISKYEQRCSRFSCEQHNWLDLSTKNTNDLVYCISDLLCTRYLPPEMTSEGIRKNVLAFPPRQAHNLGKRKRSQYGLHTFLPKSERACLCSPARRGLEKDGMRSTTRRENQQDEILSSRPAVPSVTNTQKNSRHQPSRRNPISPEQL